MVSKRLSIYGFISAATVISGLLVGCGGSSGGGTAVTPPTKTTGGVPTTTATSTTSVASSTTPQQVQVTTSTGAAVTAILPPGETITAGQPIAVITNTAPIIKGLTLSGKARGNKGAPTTSPVTGSIFIDGANSGVLLSATGVFSEPFILTTGTHTITLTGPLSISNAAGTSTTSISGGITLAGVTVATDGTAAVPTGLTLALPPDLTAFNGDDSVSVVYPTADYSTGTVDLAIYYASGTNLGQSQSLSNGIAKFAFRHPSQDAVPTSTISTITFTYAP